MPVNHRELMAVLAQLADDANIRVAVTESMKGAAFVGACTFVGGLLLGPVGFAVGGIGGGLAAAANGRNKFRPLAQVILEDMTPGQQALLATRTTAVLRDFAITDLVLLLPLIQSNANLQEALLREIIGFVQKEMNLRLMQ